MVLGFVSHDLGESVDRTEGGTEIVRHGIRERLELLISYRQVGGAVNDPLLEVRIQLADLLLRRS